MFLNLKLFNWFKSILKCLFMAEYQGGGDVGM